MMEMLVEDIEKIFLIKIMLFAELVPKNMALIKHVLLLIMLGGSLKRDNNQNINKMLDFHKVIWDFLLKEILDFLRKTLFHHTLKEFHHILKEFHHILKELLNIVKKTKAILLMLEELAIIQKSFQMSKVKIAKN